MQTDNRGSVRQINVQTDYRGSVRQINVWTDYRGSTRQINVDRQQRECQTNKCRQTIEEVLGK